MSGAACWREVGVWRKGRARCPELSRVVHCRNCDVYQRAGRQALDQVAGAEVAGWEFSDRPDRGTLECSLAFLLGNERLALPAGCLQEVCRSPAVHAIPHRSDEVVRGLAPIRGRLVLYVSLGVFLGVAKGKEESQGLLMVVAHQGMKFAFPVTRMLGVHRLDRADLAERPATLTGKLETFVRGVFELDGHSVGLLEPDALVEALRRRVAS